MSTKGKALTATIAITAALMLVLIATPSIASPAFAKPPRDSSTSETTTTTETTRPNGGLQKEETIQTTTTTTTHCENPGGQGPQGQFPGCPKPHATTSSETTSTTIDCGVSNKPGKGNPTGPDPCP